VASLFATVTAAAAAAAWLSGRPATHVAALAPGITRVRLHASSKAKRNSTSISDETDGYRSRPIVFVDDDAASGAKLKARVAWGKQQGRSPGRRSHPRGPSGGKGLVPFLL